MIVIENNIKIPSPSKEEREYLEYVCTLTNPKYTKSLNMNLNVYGIEEDLKYFYYHKSHDVIEVPVGLYYKIKEMYSDEYILDKRLSKSETSLKNLKFYGNLRDYQQEVVDEMSKKDMGIIQAPTGSGKTIMMIAHLANHNRPSLVLVNTLELANQFKERLLKFTNLTEDKIGILGGGHKSLRPITICLLQTLTRIDKDLLEFINCTYTQVISDEVHIVAANTYYTAMNNLSARFKYGFSATPKREDGLTRVLHFAAGPKLHEVDIKNISDKLEIPTYRYLETDYYFPLFDTSEYQNMLTDMAIDPERNNIIEELVGEYKGKQIVILCNRASQVIYLNKKIEGSEYLLSRVPVLTPDFRPIYRNGKPDAKMMKKKDREGVIERLNSRETDVIISTVGLFSTGIDIASLEVLILASPIKSEIKLKQALGRIMRKTENTKSPVFIDLVDKRVELLRGQARTRKKIIEKAIDV